jgi:hypothetical protein
MTTATTGVRSPRQAVRDNPQPARRSARRWNIGGLNVLVNAQPNSDDAKSAFAPGVLVEWILHNPGDVHIATRIEAKYRDDDDDVVTWTLSAAMAMLWRHEAMPGGGIGVGTIAASTILFTSSRVGRR